MFRAVLKKASVTISACGWHCRIETESTSGSKHVSGAQQHLTSNSAGTNSHYRNGGCCGYSAHNYTIKGGTERRHRRLSPYNWSSRPCTVLWSQWVRPWHERYETHLSSMENRNTGDGAANLRWHFKHGVATDLFVYWLHTCVFVGVLGIRALAGLKSVCESLKQTFGWPG